MQRNRNWAMRLGLCALALNLTTPVWACVCAGTVDFFQNMQKADAVVEAEVLSAPNADDLRRSFPLSQARIIRAFKGSPADWQPSSTIALADPQICEASIHSRELQPGSTYILALYRQPESLLRERKNASGAPIGPSYQLAPCAETALLRQGDQLFSFVRDRAAGYRPRPKGYGRYADLLQQIEGIQALPAVTRATSSIAR